MGIIRGVGALLFCLGALTPVLTAQVPSPPDKEQLARAMGQLHASTASLNACQQSAGDLAVAIARLQAEVDRLKTEADARKEKD